MTVTDRPDQSGKTELTGFEPVHENLMTKCEEGFPLALRASKQKIQGRPRHKRGGRHESEEEGRRRIAKKPHYLPASKVGATPLLLPCITAYHSGKKRKDRLVFVFM